MPYSEQKIYRALVEAAEQGLRCPVNLDLEEVGGYRSASMGATVLRRLERRGLIVVRRFQRFREVQITATGQWTTRPEGQVSRAPHVPRGMGAKNRSRARLEAQANHSNNGTQHHLGASRSAAPTERRNSHRGGDRA